MDKTTKPRFVLFTPEITDATTFAATLTAMCRAADVAAVVLRLAPANDAEQLARIEILAPAAHGIDAALLLAGHTHLVASAGADGAFVQGVGAIPAARSAVKNDHIVGVGRLDTRHDSMTAAESGADFVLFGDTNAEGERSTMPSLIERVSWWAELFVVPCVAVASQPEEINPLVRAGADFIALGDEFVRTTSDPAQAVAAANAQLVVEPV